MRREVALIATLGAALVLPATAAAAPTASVSGSTLTITGDGTAAVLQVVPIPNGVRVAGATPGPGCVAAEGGGAGCPTDASTVLQANLSGADERLRVDANLAGGTLEGRGGADTLDWAARAPATLRGGEGNDRLFVNNSGAAEDGDVQLVGEAGDDLFALGNRINSGDSANGGAGTDIVAYSNRFAPVEISQDGVRNDGFPGEGDLVGRTVEVFIGGEGADRLVSADDLATRMDGGRGADVIAGGGGRDTLDYSLALRGNAGLSVDLQAGTFPEGDQVSGIEDLVGSVGPDRLAGTGNGERIDGSSGDDVLLGRFGPDTLEGGAGQDVVSFEESTTPVTVNLAGGRPSLETYTSIEGARGGSAGDLLIGTPAAEAFAGGGGNDLFIGGLGTDAYDAGNGVDTVSYETHPGVGGTISRTASAENLDGEVIPGDVEVMRGTPGPDRMLGGAAVDTMEGIDGDDTFLTGPGADRVFGGQGSHDVLSFADQPGGALIRLSTGRIASEFREGDRSEEVEDFSGSPAADEINVAEETRRNVLRFGADDLVSYRGRPSGVTVRPLAGEASGAFAENDDIVAGIIEGTEFDDTFADEEADRAPTRYAGRGGNDIFIARGAFPAGVTDPAATAPDGFDGGDGIDSFRWSGPEPVRVSLTERRGSFNDDIAGMEQIAGGDGNDSIVGDAGPNFLAGGGGDDVLAGQGGEDRFGPEPGADTYGGGADRDVLDYGPSPSPVFVTPDGAANDGALGERDNMGADVEVSFGTQQNDRMTAPPGGQVAGLGGDDVLSPPPAPATARVLGGDGNDTLDASGRTTGALTLRTGTSAIFEGMEYTAFENLIGGAGPDTLTGSAGVNRLEGGPGSDTLDGGSGADTVLGGTGADAISDGDGDPDSLGGSTAMFAGTTAEERAQAEATAAGNAVPATKVARDDRLRITTTDATRQVSVDLSDQSTDRGDRVSDFETIIGTPRADRLFGDRDENTISGAGGDDVIEGRGNNDRLTGGDGRDTIIDGSPERDHALGGAGDDAIRVVDLAPPTNGDIAACGTGTADGADFDLRDTVTDCEGIAAAPVGQHPLTRVRALSTRPDARGRLRVRISCPRAAGRTCSGTVFIERGLRRRAKPDAIARRRYRVRSGRSIAVRLRLERTSRRALARRGRLTVRLAARELDADDRPRETSLPLRLRRPNKK